MLTFGDSQTEPSSTEEEKKQQIKNTNKNSSNLRKNNTSELTRDSDGQDNQGRGQSEFKNDIASIDIVGDLNRAFNIPNAGDQENNFNGFSGQSSQNNQQQEGNSFSQQTIKMNIMSPKVKKQIQFAKFENITTEQKKIEIQSTKNGSREDISKNSNMVRRANQGMH